MSDSRCQDPDFHTMTEGPWMDSPAACRADREVPLFFFFVIWAIIFLQENNSVYKGCWHEGQAGSVCAALCLLGLAVLGIATSSPSGSLHSTPPSSYGLHFSRISKLQIILAGGLDNESFPDGLGCYWCDNAQQSRRVLFKITFPQTQCLPQASWYK